MARSLEPDLFVPAPFEAGARSGLTFTYRKGIRERLIEAGIEFGDLTADLANGFTCERLTGGGGPYYKFTGNLFEIFADQQRAEGGGQLAVVTKVKASGGIRRRQGLAFATVSDAWSYEEQTCDLVAVHEAARNVLERDRRRLAAYARALRILTDNALPPSAEAKLHAQARQRYGALRLLVDLLKQRSDLEDAGTGNGVVIPAGHGQDDALWIRLDGDLPRPPREGGRVRLKDPASGWEEDLTCLREDGDLLVVGASANTTPPDQTKLEIHVPASFGLKWQRVALSRFLGGDVEGDWDALARLLLRPATLRPPAMLARSVHSDESADEGDVLTGVGARDAVDGLNRQQRRAVRGALATEHAFFIQGPPGTGKTTVIVEIIRRLVERGERVLLMAPMHVAVDEVLRRAGDTPGVFALRSTWNADRVRPDLRRFTKREVKEEFVRHTRTPTTSRAEGWTARLAELEDQRALLSRLLAARRALLKAQADQASAQRGLDGWWRRYQAQVMPVEHAVSVAWRSLSDVTARRAHAEAAVRRSDAALEVATREASLWTRIAGYFELGSLGALRRTSRDAADHLADVSRQRARAAHDHAARVADHTARVNAAANERAWHETARVRAAGEVERAGAEHALATADLTARSPGREVTAMSDQELQVAEEYFGVEAQRFERYLRLEQRWFEITGLGGDQRSDEGRLSALGEALISATNLVCSTTTGIDGDRDLRDVDFDTLIVDEASRVTDSEFLIGALRARRWILVGDEHQLPPYVEPVDEYHLHASTALNRVASGRARDLDTAVRELGDLWREDEDLHRYRSEAVLQVARNIENSGRWTNVYEPAFTRAYLQVNGTKGDADRGLLQAMHGHLVRSLFERCVVDCPEPLRQRLIYQHRMIDPIAAIVRQPVYDGDYLSPSEAVLLSAQVAPLVGATFPTPVTFLDTSLQPRAANEQVGTGFINRLEADWVVRACRAWERDLRGQQSKPVTVSILTFYRAQARLIRQELGGPPYRSFRHLRFQVVDAIDRIQGQESDLVVLSFCRAKPGTPGPDFALWLQDVRRLNVACTRARRALLLVGHRRTLERLSGVPRAERFYRNLFELLDEQSDVTTIVREFR